MSIMRSNNIHYVCYYKKNTYKGLLYDKNNDLHELYTIVNTIK